MIECYVNIGRINRKGTIRKEKDNKIFVNFDKCRQWNRHGFNKSQVQIIISKESQTKLF